MKKITLLIAFIGMITLQSCTVNEEHDHVDYDTISEVFEYENVNFTSANGYNVLLNFPYATYTSDMVLVYRLSGFSGGDVWKLLPETYYFPDGTLDFGYSNDFTRFNAEVVLFGYDLPGLPSSNRLNQVIRVVVIPAYLNNKTASGKLDFEDYNSVKEYYKLDTAKVTKIKM